jgi:small subunit ribosomal protein S16
MVKLRLTRMGGKKRPFFRIVATDSRAKRDGRFIEILGTYDPVKNPPEVHLNPERIKYWLSVGAQPTNTVRVLLNNNMPAE